MKCSAIVVAGGSGSRFGGHKQFVMLDGRSVAARSVDLCRVVADSVILVAPRGMTEDHYGADLVVEGGESRSKSVRAGLNMIGDDVDVVVIHDAARPLASERLFLSVVAELSDESVDGAVPGLGVVDTIKQVETVEGKMRVTKTLDRETLVAVQTPQAFRFSTLRRAHDSKREATDDAALVEACGGLVVVVPGEKDNIKITSRQDLNRVEQILEEQA